MNLISTSAAMCAGATILALSVSMPARAADASAWSQDTKSAVRLIAGANDPGETMRAGIEIRLQPRWHTYWRYPGDSGVPPRFTFTGSDNVATARVSYPAPVLFSDESGNSIGYADSVIFPVAIVPKDKSKPVVLRLKIEYAVCEKLCIPAEGKAELPLGAAPSTQDTALKKFEARVPKEVTAAEAGLTARRVNDAAKPLVAVELKTSSAGVVQIFAEGPGTDWALPIPKPAQGAPAGHRQFGFELDGLPPGVSAKAPVDLTFTVIDGDRAIEVTTRLD